MAYPGSITNEVDPISRIEGHLGVAIDVSGGKVAEAYAHGNLWRGFENFLLGHDANDAITFTQRICGVCPVPHGMTSTYAVDSVLGYSENHITFANYNDGSGAFGVPKKAVLIRNLVLSAEFLMSSITHQYHLAAPSYIQGPAIPPWTPYFHQDYYHLLMRNPKADGSPSDATGFFHGSEAAPQVMPDASGGFSKNLWSSVIRSYVVALRMRRLTFEAGALFAGRMPMTSCFIGGGVTTNGAEDLSDRCDKFRTLIQEVGGFIVKEYVPIFLALGALYPSYDNFDNASLAKAVIPTAGPASGVDLWALADNAGSPASGASANCGYGAGLGRFLAWGAFPGIDAAGTLVLPGGWHNDAASGENFSAGNRAAIRSSFINVASGVPAMLRENITNSRYDNYNAEFDASGNAYPGAVTRTKPNRDNGYTYMKAPRWNGMSAEVGPLARLVVAGLYTNGTGAAPADVLAAGGLGGEFAKYLHSSAVLGSANRLNPAMVEPDLAVALVRSGLAEFYAAGLATNVTAANVNTLSKSAIEGQYILAGSYIHGIIADWIVGIKAGRSIMDRLRARALESLYLVQAMAGTFTGTWANDGWIDDLQGEADVAGSTWRDLPIPTGTAQGWGATEAPRGALMHQVTITGGKIQAYQCIVPTTWNGSPQTGAANRGAIEQACIGLPYSANGASFTNGGTKQAEGGTEVLRAAQSFDPCIACAVH